MSTLYNILYTYCCPNSEMLHSSTIESCYSHYIKSETNENSNCINNWSFLNKQEINKKYIFNDTDIISKLCEDEVFLLKYEVRNAGHTLVNILYQIKYYIDNNYSCKILIQKELINISKYIFSIIKLFINLDKIIIIDSNKIYKFNKFIYNQFGYTFAPTCCDIIPQINIKLNLNIVDIHIPTNINVINYENYFLNYQRTILDNMLIDKIKKLNYTSNNVVKTYENICLIKTINNVTEISSNINKKYSIERSFDNEYINYFTNKNYYIFDPSEYNVTELYILLNSAKNIVTSWGCMSYINKMIIENNKINYILLCHKGYTHEFNFLSVSNMVPSCKKCILIYNLDSKLDKTSSEVINNVLDIL